MQSRETRDRDGATAPLRKRLGWLVLMELLMQALLT